MKVKHHFPKGFLWGSSTSSYQVEGGIYNCDWAIEAKRGKVPECGLATDHYNRYESDFDIAVHLSQNAHRMSVEWVRIEPEQGVFDEKEIEHYRTVLKSLKKRNIYVSLTLWHFTLPDWFYEMGGFEHNQAPEIFSRYAHYVIESLKDLVDDFCTINEPMVYTSNGYIRGNWPPFSRNFFMHFTVLRHLAKAHNDTYVRIKKDFPEVHLGIVKDNIFFEGKNIITKSIAHFLTWFWNYRFLDMIKDHIDYIGLNYYFHNVVGEKAKPPFSDFGWSIYPRGIYQMLVDLKKYQVPLYVTENGVADKEDVLRGEFISNHVREVYNAIQDGIDVRGYYYWSLLDNYEWAAGYTQRFGLVEVDFDTMKRVIRPSAYVYKFICEHNGF